MPPPVIPFPAWTSATHPLWRWLLALCAVCSAAALFAGSHLPVSDLPQHVAMISTLRHWFDPAWRFQELFTLDLGRTQYLLYYLAGAALAVPLGGAERANLALLGLIAIAFPYSLRSLLRALRQDDRLALFGAALFFNQSLIVGFFNYLAALPVTVWALALVVRKTEAPSWRRELSLAAISLVLFYLHLSALVFFLPAAALCLWLLPEPAARGFGPSARELVRRLRGLWKRLLWTLPVGGLCLHFLAKSPVVHPQSIGWSGEQMHPHYPPLKVVFRHFPAALLDVWHGPTDTVLMVALGVLAVLLLPWPKLGATGGGWRRAVGGLFAFFALVLYFVMPESLGWLYWLNERYGILFALLLPAALRPALGLRGAVPLLAVAIVALGLSGHAALGVREFGREVGDFDRLLARTQPGRKLQAVVREQDSAVAKFNPFHHFGAFYRARYGGAAEYSFADLPQSPVRYRPESAPPVKPPGWEWDETFRNEVDGPYFDYLLWRGDPQASAPSPPGPGWHLLGRDGRWSLFEKDPAPR